MRKQCALAEQREAHEETKRQRAVAAAAENESRSIEQPSALLYPNYIEYSSTSGALAKEDASTVPSIDIQQYCREVSFAGWLSSKAGTVGVEGATAAAPDLDDPLAEDSPPPPLPAKGALLSEALDATHISQDNWRQACDLFRFPHTDVDSRSSVGLRHWSKRAALKPYQFFAATFVLKRICSGEDIILVALDMGLGKTAVSLAVLLVLSGACQRYNAAKHIPFGPLAQTAPPPVDNATNFNLTRLVGHTPVVHQGVALIVVCGSVELINNWVQERRKFIPGDGLKFVVAHLAKWTKTERAAKGPDVYHYKDVVKPKDWPPDEDLRGAGWSAAQIEGFREQGGIPMKDFLSPTEDGLAERWHHRWVVITTQDSLASCVVARDHSTNAYVKAPPKEKDDFTICATWRIAIVDEFHHVRSNGSTAFRTIGSLPGNPPIVGLSGTPFNKTKDIAPIFIAAHAKYFTCTTPKTNQPKSVFDLSPADYSSETGLTFKTGLSQAQQRAVRKSSFIDMWPTCLEVDKFVDDRTLASAQAATESTATQPDHQAVRRFKEWIRPRMIQFDADLMWQPDPSRPAMSAVEMPPHSGFDVRVDTDPNYKAALTEQWQADVDQINREDGGVRWRGMFFKVVDKFRVLMLFPCLEELMRTDTNLRHELGDMTVKECRYLLREADSTALWQSMRHIHRLANMTLLRQMIEQLRAMKNWAGHGRKIVVTAHKPMNAVICYLVSRSHIIGIIKANNCCSTSSGSSCKVASEVSRPRTSSSSSNRFIKRTRTAGKSPTSRRQ